MQRIVVVSSGLAGAKTAARIKRLAPEIEVNLVVPGEMDTAAPKGPFSRITAAQQISETLTEARQVGVIQANEVQFDFEQQQVVVRSKRGVIQIRFNQVVLEVEATPRLPRSLRAADNVVPWPLEDGGLLDSWIQESTPARAVVVGGGTALNLLSPILESGMSATWVRTADATFDPDVWDQMAGKVAAESNGRITVEDWSDVRLEGLVPVLDEDGRVTALQNGRDDAVSGDLFFWTEPQRALHPIIAQPGVELDASGLIVVDEHFRSGPEGLHVIGSAVSMARLPKGGARGAVPSVAMGQGAVLASSRVLANHLAGFVNDSAKWEGAPGVFRFAGPGVLACKVGLTMQEAVAAGYEPEFAVQSAVPGLGGHGGAPVLVKLVCDRHSHAVLGVQVVASEQCGWADTVAGSVAMAMAASMTVERMAVVDFACGGGELLQRVAAILANKLLYRFNGISAEELLASKASGANFFMLDLRDNVAWKNGHIEDAYNIPYTQLKKRLQDEVPRFTPIVLISSTSGSAYSAACQLFGLGATELYVLDGGMDLWPFGVAKG